MTQPTMDEISAAVWATWPASGVTQTDAFLLRRSGDDSRRSRAASARRPVTDQEVAAAAHTMRGWDQPAMFWVPGSEPDLDAQLSRLGFDAHDHSVYYGGESRHLAATPPPRVTTFEIWEPLAIMSDIWTETGTSSDRQSIMAGARCPKTAILGRVDAQPAAVAYVGAAGRVAMLHALATRPKHRRKGLARHMMAQAALWAARMGCDWLTLAVGRENAPARALYETVGMAPVGTYHYRSLKETP